MVEVYFGDMAQYGSGGTATAERNASGIRLLGVSPESRELGVGKALTSASHVTVCVGAPIRTEAGICIGMPVFRRHRARQIYVK